MDDINVPLLLLVPMAVVVTRSLDWYTMRMAHALNPSLLEKPVTVVVALSVTVSVVLPTPTLQVHHWLDQAANEMVDLHTMDTPEITGQHVTVVVPAAALSHAV